MAISSMTGYGSEITKDGYLVEIRSLNSRYLDIAARIPQELYPYESDFKSIIKSYFVRGSIELVITHKNIERNVIIPRLNRSYASYYVDILKELSSMGIGSVDISSLLQIRDIVYIDIDERAVKEALKNIISSIDNVCKLVREMRYKEGAAIVSTLRDNLSILRDICKKIEGLKMPQVENIRKSLSSKLTEVFSQTQIDLNQGRFEEEVLYYINRLDISEEVDRLSSHIEQFENLLRYEWQVGRRLDFLCQEMLREFNTIGAKSTMIEIKRFVITGKDIVEKLREQVQNIE